ncbi:MAG: N-carbamoylputrescine amidase [Oscillospiraceae bacterium]|nr:N-carbamoylputrescine amidase [Oscillospiraceae bacterium]
MRTVQVAAVQMACSRDRRANIEKAEGFVRGAAAAGANIILLQELFQSVYFCQKEKYEYFSLAKTIEDDPAIRRFSAVAKELHVVLPISFYEACCNTAFNSLVVIDADGSVMETYRKTHIPDGHCYEEKFYFSPGDTGFKVWDTAFAKIGVGICWDQWFPETARCLALLGAEIFLFPTAIGSEPVLELDSQPHWQRAMQGHAAANIVPVVAANRVGMETEDDSSMTFYGSSFITDETGGILASANRESECFISASLDLDEIALRRRGWGVFRDRRPEMYHGLFGFGK